MADGESLQMTICGRVRLRVQAGGVGTPVWLTGGLPGPRLAKNIVSYGKLKRKGFAIAYDV